MNKKIIIIGLGMIILVLVSLFAIADGGYINAKFICSETGTNCADLSNAMWADPVSGGGGGDRIAATSTGGRTAVLEADDSGNYVHVGSETAHGFRVVRNDVARMFFDSADTELMSSTGGVEVRIYDSGATHWYTPGLTTGSSEVDVWSPHNFPGFRMLSPSGYRTNIARTTTGLGFAASSSATSPGYIQLFLEDGADVGIYDETPDARLDILNTGTGDSFRIDDSSDGDTTPFIINNAGQVGIGTTSLAGKLIVVGDEVRVGSGGTVNWATGTGDLYVQHDLEVDGRGAIVAYAMMDATGSVDDCWNCNTNTLETRKISTGTYEVDFTPLSTDIRAYPRLASLGSHGNVLSNTIGLADRGTDTSSIYVRIYDADNPATLVDSDFTIVILSI